MVKLIELINFNLKYSNLFENWQILIKIVVLIYSESDFVVKIHFVIE